MYAPDGVDQAARRLLLSTGLLAALALSPLLRGASTQATDRVPLLLAVTALIVFRAARTVNAHVAATGEALIIGNVWRTYRIPWDEVESLRIETEELGPYPLGSPAVDVARRYEVPEWALLRDSSGVARKVVRVAVKVAGRRRPIFLQCVSREALLVLTGSLQEHVVSR